MKNITQIVHEFSSRWLNIFNLTIESNGRKTNWLMASRLSSPKIKTNCWDADAVIIKAVIKGDVFEEDRLVVTCEYRYPLNGYEIGVPAGLIDKYEDPRQTALRELAEETGYIEFIKFDEDISPPLYSSSGLTDESVYVVSVIIGSKKIATKLDVCEDIKTYALTRDEIIQLLKTKKIDDQEVKFGAKGFYIMREFINEKR